jgi:hypothetical protein
MNSPAMHGMVFHDSSVVTHSRRTTSAEAHVAEDMSRDRVYALFTVAPDSHSHEWSTLVEEWLDAN